MKNKEPNGVLVMGVVVVALLGAAALWFFDQWLWIPLWLAFGVVLLIRQLAGADAAANTLFVFAGVGALVSAGVHVNQSPFSLSFDPLGFILALGLLVVAIYALVRRTAKLLFITRGGERRASMQYMLQWLFGMETSYQEVREGKVIDLLGRPPKPARHEQIQTPVTTMMVRPRGHLALFIHPGNTVVYERNGEYAGVLGPGMHFLTLEESVRKVIVTYQRSGSNTIKDILTKDGIPVTVEYSVSYRIEPRTQPELGKPYPYSEEACMKAAYNAPNWESKIVNGAGGLLADKIAGMTIDELFDLRNATTYPVGEMMNALRAKLQERANRYGAVILGFDIDKLDVPPSVREQMLARWRTHLAAQLRLELSAKALKLVAEQTGQADPKVAMQLMDHVLGLGGIESLSIGDYGDYKREMERRLMEEFALQEALARPRTRSTTPSPPPSTPIQRP